MLRILILFTLLASLSACGILPNLEDETENWTARQLYEESKKALSAADYETALQHLETLEARFPFGRYAQQAQFDMIYAYYKFDEPGSSIAAADRFIKLYPRHPRVSYAYYMRGLSSYEYKKSFLDRLFRLDPTERDNAAPQEAFQYFATLIRLYPESDYAKDAALRLRHLHNLLARHEIRDSVPTPPARSIKPDTRAASRARKPPATRWLF